MGRLPKSTAQHKADGTYREDRHGGRLDAHVDSGLPSPPFELSKDERWAWNLACNNLPPAAIGELDALALFGLASWYGRWLTLRSAALKNPADMHMASMEVSAWKQVTQLLGRFGMTPADRAKIQFEANDDEEADIEAELNG